MIEVRLQRDADRNAAISLETSVVCTEEEDMTEQQHRDEVDINRMMARYLRTGELPPPREGFTFGDFSQVGTFQEGLQLLRAAQEAFDLLPAAERERHGHNAAVFADWVTNPENAEEARRRGLLPKASAEVSDVGPQGAVEVVDGGPQEVSSG